MAQVQTAIRLANPGRRKTRVRTRRKNSGKRMTLAQKLYFGSARQRAAAKASLGRKRPSHKRRTNRARAHTTVHRKRRRRNVGQILVATNPGTVRRRHRKRRKAGIVSRLFSRLTNSRRTKSNMARARRRRNPRRVRVYRRRRNPVARTHRRRTRRSYPQIHRRRRRSNPGVVVRYRNRGRRRHSHHRRRNPGFSSIGVQVKRIAGLFGGAYVTKAVMNYIPPTFSQGMLGYVVTAIVSYLQGKLAGKMFKSNEIGQSMTEGGYVYLALKVASDFGLPFGLSGIRGMGLIAPSSFYVPQVPRMGSMGAFMVPPGVPTPMVASGMHGLMPNNMGGGRMSQRRIGRVG